MWKVWIFLFFFEPLEDTRRPVMVKYTYGIVELSISGK